MIRSSLPLSLTVVLFGCPAEPPPTVTPTPVEPAPAEPTLDLAARPTALMGELALPDGQSIAWFIELSGPPGQFEAAKLWIPEQGLSAQPFDEVEDRGAEVVLRWKALTVEYTLAFADELGCSFTQSGVTIPCDLDTLTAEELAEATALERPQEPKPPFPYAIEEVVIPNPAATGVQLAGTLTVPEGPGPHPVVVLITGSGPQDRDESLLGHKPFWVLADHLTRHGIAVLRYDDRGVGKSTGDLAKSTMVDFASDAWAVVEYLRTRPELDPKRVGLIGHSEGGVVGPMVAAAHPTDIAFVVMLAGTGVDGSAIIRHQAQLIGKAGGTSDEQLAKDAALGEKIHAAATLPSEAEAKLALDAVFREATTELTAEELAAAGGLEQVVSSQVDAFMSPWMRQFLIYDPAPTLKQLKMPVLAVFAERDLQVDPDQNLPVVKKALKRNRKAEVVELPGLNHLFQPATTGSPSEYATITTTLDPALLELVTDWLREQAKLD